MCVGQNTSVRSGYNNGVTEFTSPSTILIAPHLHRHVSGKDSQLQEFDWKVAEWLKVAKVGEMDREDIIIKAWFIIRMIVRTLRQNEMNRITLDPIRCQLAY